MSAASSVVSHSRPQGGSTVVRSAQSEHVTDASHTLVSIVPALHSHAIAHRGVTTQRDRLGGDVSTSTLTRPEVLTSRQVAIEVLLAYLLAHWGAHVALLQEVLILFGALTVDELLADYNAYLFADVRYGNTYSTHDYPTLHMSTNMPMTSAHKSTSRTMILIEMPQ